MPAHSFKGTRFFVYSGKPIPPNEYQNRDLQKTKKCETKPFLGGLAMSNYEQRLTAFFEGNDWKL